MVGEEVVSTASKVKQRIRTRDSVEVADATAPIDQVEGVLNPTIDWRLTAGWSGVQLLRSAACTAGSRSTARRGSLPLPGSEPAADSEAPCAWAPFAPP